MCTGHCCSCKAPGSPVAHSAVVHAQRVPPARRDLPPGGVIGGVLMQSEVIGAILMQSEVIGAIHAIRGDWGR